MEDTETAPEVALRRQQQLGLELLPDEVAAAHTHTGEGEGGQQDPRLGSTPFSIVS